jgi:tRNA-Thr(GGU) m(6)t(6)A37 methyltransferase TsaA
MKKNDQIVYTPIGIIRSPFTDISGMPIQPSGAKGVRGTVEIFEMYGDGLTDLEGFSRIILIYSFHRCDSCQMAVTPFLDNAVHGIFATRAPCRPNAIGLSVVRLIKREGRMLAIEDIDVLDCTPLLDIKPYVPQFDAFPDSPCGWLEKNAERVKGFRSDDRFHSQREE